MTKREAKKREDAQIIARTKQLRKLIGEVGLTLHGWDPGVSAYITEDMQTRPSLPRILDFNRAEWAWLEPLLKELVKLRREARKAWING